VADLGAGLGVAGIAAALAGALVRVWVWVWGVRCGILGVAGVGCECGGCGS